ncbi:MAG TPA: hemerythrin domain-containing protein [Rhodocyclaceae bacterium]|nr:hemerythrin domain-containing protein [Rhodocyclaceae bacterium]
MRRDERLIELSREHHTALTLARRLRLAHGSSEALAAAGASVRSLHAELEQHFDEEEVRLLPILRACAPELASQLMHEHVALRALLERSDEAAALERLGTLLEAHVRFEERVMFPRLEDYWRASGERAVMAPPACRASDAATRAHFGEGVRAEHAHRNSIHAR